MSADARLDAFIARHEQGLDKCLDCEVGEPHVCPVIWKGEQKRQARLLAHFQEHQQIDAMFTQD